MSRLSGLLKNAGFLRIGLYLLLLANFIATPSNEIPDVYDWATSFTHLLMPIFAPILFMLVMLDAIVSKIYMSGLEGITRTNYRIIVWWDIFLGVSMLLYWIPFYFGIDK